MHEHPTTPLGEGVRCQNCGDFVGLSQVERHPPDRVLIDRAAYWWRTPRHADLVAIKNGRGRLQAKRIIGVPGDQIGLHQSSVRINGRRVDAVLPPEQIPSILVFDTAHLDRIGPRWQVADTGQWMVYHHRSIHDKNQPAPIRDDYPANTAVSRQLMPVWHGNNRARTQGAARYSYSYSNRRDMNDIIIDHDRLDVYRLSIEYVARSFAIAKDLSGLHRHARDQWLRAAQSIPLNIAEGNGKRSLKDRNRFLDVARGSALECAAIQDILAATDGLDTKRHGELKHGLKRIVSMLTRLIARADAVADLESEYEYRFAEYEHEGCAEPEPSRPQEPGLRPSSNGQSTFPAR